MRIVAFAVGLAMVWAAESHAAPLQLKSVSDDAKWLAHIDVDAMRSSSVMQKFRDEWIRQTPGTDQWLAQVRERWGIDLRTGLHGMTLYGSKLAPHHMVLIVSSDVNKETMLERARQAPDHGTVKYRDHEIHTWTDGKGTEHAHQGAGVFYKPNVLVFATGADRVKKALDVLDGKAGNLAGQKSSLAAPVPEGTVFLARAVDLGTADFPGQPAFLGLIKQLDYAEGEHAGQWRGVLSATADSEQVANQLKDVLQGFLAVVTLHFHDQPAFVSLMQKAEVKVEGKTVSATFAAPAGAVADAAPTFVKAVKEHIAHHRAMHASKEGPHRK